MVVPRCGSLPRDMPSDCVDLEVAPLWPGFNTGLPPTGDRLLPDLLASDDGLFGKLLLRGKPLGVD